MQPTQKQIDEARQRTAERRQIREMQLILPRVLPDTIKRYRESLMQSSRFYSRAFREVRKRN